MATWGGTTISVKQGTYLAAHVPPDYVVMKNIGDYSNHDEPNEIVHQPGGRPLKRITFTAQVTSLSDYGTLLAARTAGTAAMWTGPYGDTLTLAIIFDLGAPDVVKASYVRFKMALLEVPS